MRKLLVFAFASLLLLTTCKKYEDGPWLSLRTAEKRICGEWTIENYYENGTDLTSDFEKSLIYCSRYEFINEELSATVPFNTVASGCKRADGTGWWYLTNENKNLSWTMGLVDVPQHPLEMNSNWAILRLTNKEFWISTTFNGTEYEIHLKAI